MIKSKISDYLEGFLIAKEIEEGCSNLTIKSYRYDLNQFIEMQGDLNLDSIDANILRQKIRFFLKHLKDNNCKKRTIARKIATLRSFFKFLIENDHINKNPMLQIKSPKIRSEENLPKFLEDLEVRKIFDTVKNKTIFDSKKSKRYYLVIRLLFTSMARISELCNIKIKDVDLEKGYIRLRGKGNKERLVPVDKKTITIIKESLQERSEYDKDDPLLINIRGGKLKPRIVQRDIKAIKQKCGFPESKVITPHTFRHTGATHLRRAGMDISELQDILGHSNPNTTKIYARNDPIKLKSSHDKMHPLNKNEDL